MRSRLQWGIFFLLLPLLISCTTKEKHFLTDKKYRKTVHQDYLLRKEMAKGREEALFSVMKENLTLEEREAMEFLFAYMPLSDLADYSGDYFLDQVRYSFKARDYFSWGETIPEDIFRHFVLVYRVNNEDLDTARKVIFEEIKDRVKGLSMYDAALEVNHWCHEKVTYRPSDSRTSSSLATMKSAHGRCGEESTFTVAAMRAVGIPARQCYTPKWAHTNGNHAWVEVWVDGKWYYMGACEPDAKLNMGWFDVPATRAMMVHANTFGKYEKDEEVNYSTHLFSTINMLPNYTKTRKITATVLDVNGNPIEGAEVLFKLYNYAEFHPIAMQKSNKSGQASIVTGYGDLLVWAKKNNAWQYAQIKIREEDNVTLILDVDKKNHFESPLVINYKMNPPSPLQVTPKATQEEIELNNKRLKYEDSIRNAYLATFPTEEDAKNIKNENLTKEQIWNIVRKSEGNYKEMEKLLQLYQKKDETLLLNDFFLSLSDKDHRDGQADILSQHITYYNPDRYPLDVYLKGIISPRIANEAIRSWRNYLAKALPAELGEEATPLKISDWIKKHITEDEDGNYFRCPISPVGVYELRHSDKHSIDIFFVAACRSLDIPAYRDAATGQVYAYENGVWQKYQFSKEEKTNVEKSTLILTYQGNQKAIPKYSHQYTIAKEENGDFNAYNYYEGIQSQYPITMEVDPGNYMLTTGNRYFDGDVLARLEFFTIKAGETVTKEIVIRDLEPREMNYGTMATDYLLEIPKQGTKSVKELMGGKELIICFIDPTREPTAHLLGEISQDRAFFDSWGGTILFVIPSGKSAPNFKLSKSLPKKAIFLTDEESIWMNTILKETDQHFQDNYPLVFIVNQDGVIHFKSEGYRIDTGTLLYKSLRTK